MKEPKKTGTDDSKTKEGGALGNIDEERGHPGKGTGGASTKAEESGDRSKEKNRVERD